MATEKTVTLADGTVLKGAAARNYGKGGSSSPSTGAPSTPTSPSSTADPFMAEIQSRLLGQADMISSSNTGIEAKIKEAIGGIEKSTQASGERIASQYDREIAFQGQVGANNVTDALESRRGFATQMVGFRQLVETTDKNLKDLEQRKQEALLLNDSTAAQQISDLQFKAMEFQQQAQQNMYNNLLGLGQFGNQLQQTQLAIKQEARNATAQEWQQKFQEEQFAFQKASTLEEQRMSQIRINLAQQELALKKIQEGTTLDPDPGFGTVTIQENLGNLANTKLAGIQAKVDSGEIQRGSEEEAATIAAYMELRRMASKSGASDDALAGLMGLKFDDSGELGFPSSGATEPLPTDGNWFDKMFGATGSMFGGMSGGGQSATQMGFGGFSGGGSMGGFSK